jgi:polar amino acid transport system permease protein
MNWGEAVRILALGLPNTIVITLGAFVIGMVLGLPVALARLSRRAALNGPATVFVEIVRGIPPLAWIFVTFYGLGQAVGRLDPIVTAVAALGFVATAYMAEIYRAALQSVPPGQLAAGRAIGLGDVSVLVHILLPQAAILAIPAAATYCIGLLKESALASIIGASEVTYRAMLLTDRTLHGLDVFAIAAVLYVGLSVPLALFARWSGHWFGARFRPRST